MSLIYVGTLDKLFRTGVEGRNRERKNSLNFHCFQSQQFGESNNESCLLIPCFVYTFSFQNTKKCFVWNMGYS